jgi:hypothetical protein
MNKQLIFSALTFLSIAYSFGQKLPKKEISEIKLKQHIQFLAADALEGRLTGSAGEKISADYIEKEFKAAGLQPVQIEENSSASYQHSFPFVRLRITTNKTKFAIVPNPDMTGINAGTMAQFKVFEEFYPLPQSASNDSITADFVDCGYGLIHEATQRNDFADYPDLSGKICVMRLGYMNEASEPNNPLKEVSDIQTKINHALARNARGIVFINGFNINLKNIPTGKLTRTDKPLSIPIFYYKTERTLPPKMNLMMVSRVAAPTVNAVNVMGFRNNHKKHTIVICAHHDHIGFNEYDNSRYTGPRAIHNGADDNASGVAAMLELARTLKGKKYKKFNYLFIAFSGEEMGLLGSKYFINHAPIFLSGKVDSTKLIAKETAPNAKLAHVNYVLNIDMLGRLDSSKRVLAINGVGTSPQFPKTVKSLKLDTTKIKITTTESGNGPSDHASFYLENIPVVHFFTGQHEDYHKPSDDEEKINYSGMKISLDAIQQFIAINNKAKKLPFTKTKDQTTGRMKFKVSLGVMPDYTWSGKGMRIDGASDGKPAQKAGLQKGDIITKLGTFSINSIDDYMSALGKLEPGSAVSIEIQRNNQTLTLPIQL